MNDDNDTSTPAPTGPLDIKICIPFYVYPTIWEDSNAWKTLVETAANSRAKIIAVVNPNNGPGDEVNSDYVTGIAMLREADIEVIGYIHTSYAQKPLSDVSNDIQKWSDFYQITGMFVDECCADNSNIGYYRSLSDVFRANEASTIIINPGLEPTNSYFDVADGVVTFENYYEEWAKQRVTGRGNESSCVLIHSCGSEKEMRAAVDKIANGR
eukprot:Ihof_evm2s313 gene=Ihof_evmTU2s313